LGQESGSPARGPKITFKYRQSTCKSVALILAMRQRKIDYRREAKKIFIIAVRRGKKKKKSIIAVRQRRNRLSP
jgi:hypothetical protein